MPAPVDDDLTRSTVFRNMDYRWQKFGLSFEDLPILAAPFAIGFLVMGLVHVSMGWLFLVELCTAVFLVMVKWRKPPDHLQGLLILHFGKRRLSHKLRDPLALEFPWDEDLQPRLPEQQAAKQPATKKTAQQTTSSSERKN